MIIIGSGGMAGSAKRFEFCMWAVISKSVFLHVAEAKAHKSSIETFYGTLQ